MHPDEIEEMNYDRHSEHRAVMVADNLDPEWGDWGSEDQPAPAPVKAPEYIGPELWF